MKDTAPGTFRDPGLSLPVTGAAGVHDLYLMLDTAEARVASVAFDRPVTSEGTR